MFSSIPHKKTTKKPQSVSKPSKPIKQQVENQTFTNPTNSFARRPKTLTCSICGREFGQTSLEIHQKTCIKKYQNELMNLPQEFKKNMASTHQMMQQIEQEKQFRQNNQRPQSGLLKQSNKINQDQFMMQQQPPNQFIALVPCRKCGRKFNADRIQKHQSVCIGPEPDIQGIKQQQLEQNQRVARRMRPKQTGIWRQQHLELVHALKEMRKQKFQEQKIYKQQQQNSVKRSQYQDNTRVQYKAQDYQKINYQKGNLRSSSSKPIPKNFGGGFNQSSGYGRDTYDIKTQGKCSGVIANSNVSTFSLFTNDGKPKDYTNYQRTSYNQKKY